MNQEITDRFKALTDLNEALNHNNMSINNHGVELKRIIDENDTDKLEQLEQLWSEFQEVKIKETKKLNRIQAGEAKQALCKSVINMFNGYLAELELTDQQAEDLDSDLDVLFTALQKSQVGKAKSMIQSLEINTIITEEIKNDILSLFEV